MDTRSRIRPYARHRARSLLVETGEALRSSKRCVFRSKSIHQTNLSGLQDTHRRSLQGGRGAPLPVPSHRSVRLGWTFVHRHMRKERRGRAAATESSSDSAFDSLGAWATNRQNHRDPNRAMVFASSWSARRMRTFLQGIPSLFRRPSQAQTTAIILCLVGLLQARHY
jgi:hypothetical protein